MSSRSDLRADLSLALSLADDADAISMARFGASDLVVESKPDLTPVSEADRAVEQSIRRRLADERPDDGVLGEEYGAQGSTRRQWIVDPIDGTRNYVRGVPVWATLIALLEDEVVTVGVVSAPALSRRWWAARGDGAYRVAPGVSTPQRMSVSGVRDLADASFSFSDPVGWDRRTSTGLAALLDTTWRQRAYGDFWSHMLVAEGVVDIAAEPELETYDMAALVPIVEEAGGRMTSFDGGSALGGGSALTTNGALHAAVLELLAV
ncbi:MAG: histidinol-phosphatase [Actinomycetales bacterium]|nr:histidinol-phosphatase [Actinomycetales bacterium]